MICEVDGASGVRLTRTGTVKCDGELHVIEYQGSFDFTQIPPEQILAYLSMGLMLYVVFWSIGVGLKAVFSLLK